MLKTANTDSQELGTHGSGKLSGCFYLFLFAITPAITEGVALMLMTPAFRHVVAMFNSSIVYSLIFGLLLIMPPRAARIAILALSVPIAALSVTQVVYARIYLSSISPFAVQSMLETSANESSEFFSECVSISNVSLAAVVTLFCFWITRKALYASARLGRSLPVSRAGFAVVMLVAAAIVINGDPLIRPNTAYVMAKTALEHGRDIYMVPEIVQGRKGQKFPGMTMLDGEDEDTRRNYVFIIGESANRNHMSVYGYHRPTTPLIQARKDVLKFTDVAAACTHTIQALRGTLLFHDLDGRENILAARSIIGLLDNAGFDTWWLSNQTDSADGLTGVAVIAGDADGKRFFNKIRSSDKEISYDETLLPALEEVLSGPGRNKAVFLHLMGSHVSYNHRYPKEFNVFRSIHDIPDAEWRGPEEKQIINEYDNSILHTDHFVNEVIETVKRHGGRAMVVYISDHGQEVYDTLPIRGQEELNPTRNMFDVPLFCWFSEEYKKANPEILKVAQANLHKPFSLNYFSQSAAELSRIGFDEFNPRYSIFSKEYASPLRLVNVDGNYDKLPGLPGTKHGQAYVQSE